MAKRVLLLGGHGKISLLMTPMLLSHLWSVTSVIRNPDQKDAILERGRGQPGKLDVLISSLDDIKSDQQAQAVLDQIKPDWVIWSAGAGGKGGAERTYAVDRDAAKHYIAASVKTSSVTKFLMVSYCANRRSKAPWWDDEDWAGAIKTNKEILPDYHLAKIEADEYLTALARQRDSDFDAIVLRPGTLTDDAASGMISLGKTKARGQVSRADVANVATKLLSANYSGWIDLLGGNEEIDKAIARVVKDKIDCVEGESVDAMIQKYKL